MGQPVLDKKALMRDKKAQGMAAMGLVSREGDRFRVVPPTLRGHRKSYEVWRDEAGKVRCTCLEFEEESANDPKFRCEHILAVKHAVLAKNVTAVAAARAEEAVPTAPEAEAAPAPAAEEEAVEMLLPWEVPPLDTWVIAGMFHYPFEGSTYLHVTMVNGANRIRADGPFALQVFAELRAQVERLRPELPGGDTGGNKAE